MAIKTFHFDCGNSSEGPIGFCAAVQAETVEGAVELLKERLPEDLAVMKCAGEDGEYIEVYFNADKVTVSDCEE